MYITDYRCLKSDIIGFTETQIKPSDSGSIIDDTVKDFDIDFNRNDYKFLSIAYGCQIDTTIIGSLTSMVYP